MSRTYKDYYGTSNIKGQWHHLCLTYDKPTLTLKLLVDGEVEKTISYSFTTTSTYFDLFNWSTTWVHNADYRPACKLSDVRVYDHCLSAREVREICSGQILHYKFDNTYSSIIADCGGYDYAAMIKDIPNYEDTMQFKYLNCLKLTNNNYITCGRSSDAEDVSVSMWIKPGDIPTANQVVFADQSSKLAFGFYSFKADNETNYISKKAIISCAGQYSNVVSNLEDYWKKDDWNHIVVTKSGVDYNCYLNNNKLPKITKTNYWDHFAENTLTIGCRNNGAPSTFYTGGISDFRMYGTTLSEDIIKQLYQTPISLSNNYTLFSNELLEEENSTSSFLKTGTVKANEIRDCEADGKTPAAKLQIFADTIQSTDFIEW